MSANQRHQHTAPGKRKTGSAVLLAVLLVVLFVCVYKHATAVPASSEPVAAAEATPKPTKAPIFPGKKTPKQPDATPEPTPDPTPEPTPEPTPVPEFHPYHTEETDPANFVKDLAVQVNGTTLGSDEVYVPEEIIDFLPGDEYTDVEGIVTFRGNNFRDGGAYGYADLKNYKFSDSWSINTGALTSKGETWTGSGWVGQPLIVKWPKETKAIMNMYDWAKTDDDLVEVIYATMDGHIYFLDLNTGNKTRDSLNVGYTFKGAGSLDPRGYPLLYVGAGYDSNLGTSRAFIISLIDFDILYTFGNGDSFMLRDWPMFDGSPLVDAETDQLIYPGENGVVYIIKLNTDYDPTAGTISIAPQTVKWRYYGKNTTLMQYWIGMEDNPVIWRGHLIIADNGGRLMCLDLNTLTLDWVQNILDDSNGTPVLSMEDGHPYIYISTSFHLGWRSWNTAEIPIFKIDAENGEIVWKTSYTCYTESGVSGGVQSTIALGKHDLEGYIYVTVAKTDTSNNGILACIDTKTGEVVWEHHSYYTWSSPVLVYDESGHGTLVFCNYANMLYMIDPLSGTVLDSFNLLGGVEASPAVYENTVVVGTRKCKIWGVKMS